jgi:hypothetical protein
MKIRKNPVWSGSVGLPKTDRFNLKIFKKLTNFEIKNPKKTRLNFKNFDENRIQKLISFHPRKIKEVYTVV